jgi:hypothetical protein
MFSSGAGVFSMLLAALGAAGPAFPDVEGWAPAGAAQRYDRETLFEVINGAAELYFSYGFVELQMRDLASGSHKVTLSLYDMGDPLNAFGIFRTERPAEAPPVRAGAEAVVVGTYQCLMQKDRFYVKAEALQGRLDAARCKSLLEPVARALPGTSSRPKIFERLPPQHRMPGSLGFARRNFLGSSALNHCVHAQYTRPGKAPLTVFVMLPQAGQTAEQLWTATGRQHAPSTIGTRKVIAWEIPYRGTVVLVRGKAGLRGAVDTGEARDVLAGLESVLGRATP